jgi:hypothetical protein
MFSNIRKAVVAGFSAGLASAISAWIAGSPTTTAGWGALIGAALAVGISAGVATYKVDNVKVKKV